jgi:putative ATP-dependent endonuclease of OLD family
MKITHVQIRNYRSIKQLDLTPGDLTALVGPNDAGKTNILSALHFLLGDRWPTSNGLDDKDFFQKRRDDGLLIKVWFGANPQHIHSVWFEMVQGQGNARYQTTQGHAVGAQPRFLSNDVRNQCALVYVDASRNFDSQFGSSRWSLFGQIIRHLDAYFRDQVGQDIQQQVKDHMGDAQELLKTDLYRSFERAVAEGFEAQVRLTTHAVRFDFRTFDPLNFYRSLYPVLIEGGDEKNPSEVGSGMRNLIVLALFRAYAKAFRGDSLIAIEEPEIYLHPHAQRSLAALFRELAEHGAQIFYSTHSAAFLSIEHFDQVAVAERRPDADNDICTQLRRLTATELLRQRQQLHPGVAMTEASLRERLRNACTIEHGEAFFSRAIVLVEGETEQAALPVYAAAIGIDLDALGISIVSAGGKAGLDMLYQLYDGLGFPVFLMFDNDAGGDAADIRLNQVLTRLLGLQETDQPAPQVSGRFAIVDPDFEGAVRTEVGADRYGELKAEATGHFGSKAGKPIVGRYIARRLTEQGMIPPTIRAIIAAVQAMLAQAGPPEPDEQFDPAPAPVDDLDDEIPF